MVTSHRFNERLCTRKFSKCDSEVIGIIERVHQIAVEGVDIGEFGERVERRLKLFGKLLSCEFDFACVESTDTTDFEAASSVQFTVSGLKTLKRREVVAYICVGSRRCVLDRTMSSISCEVGTGAISFHVSFMVAAVLSHVMSVVVDFW